MFTSVTKNNEGAFTRFSGFETSEERCEMLASYGWLPSFKCHNVTIMKNAQGDRVIIQEVK